MQTITWELSGHCLEMCNCDFLCPCIPSNRTATPTRGNCTTVLTFNIDDGHIGDVRIADLSFCVVVHTPGVMADGDWAVGVIVDERASQPQRDALVAVARGEIGGPLEPMAVLTKDFLGVESRRIEFEKNGMRWSVSIPERIEQVAQGAPSPVSPGEPIYLDNTGHRANPRIAIARASRNEIHAFGLDWHDNSGTNSSAYAPFHWKVSTG